MMKDSCQVASVEETWRVARGFATRLSPGAVVCLEGGLGAGKTTFTQALAAALGATGRVASPTFCIVREHPVPAAPEASPRRPSMLVHMDLYRLDGEDDVVAIGWDDYLARGAVIAVEWPERAGTLIPPDAWRVSIKIGKGDEERTIEISRALPDAR